MEPITPEADTSSASTSPRHREPRRHRIVAAGLIGLPVLASVLLLPATANATGAAAGGTDVFHSATAVHSSHPSDDDLSEGAVVEVFATAGYSYDDALVLSRSWGLGDALAAKAKAGDFLAHGTALADTPYADRLPDDGYDDARLTAIFHANGYTHQDALVLADRWGVSVAEAKAKAGRELWATGVLPFVDPTPVDAALNSDSGSALDSIRFDAYVDAGYGYGYAVALAAFWGVPSIGEAKLKAGAWLLGGLPLPTVAEPVVRS